jgi:hypothetical protein
MSDDLKKAIQDAGLDFDQLISSVLDPACGGSIVRRVVPLLVLRGVMPRISLAAAAAVAKSKSCCVSPPWQCAAGNNFYMPESLLASPRVAKYRKPSLREPDDQTKLLLLVLPSVDDAFHSVA